MFYTLYNIVVVFGALTEVDVQSPLRLASCIIPSLRSLLTALLPFTELSAPGASH